MSYPLNNNKSNIRTRSISRSQNQIMTNVNTEWSDRGSFWEHNSPQGEDKWLEARIGRVTGSVAGSLLGLSNFDTPMETGLIISGTKKKEFSERSKYVMKHGTDTEPAARNWYINNNKCKVVERGLCVPKWNVNIGASVDGDVLETDGIIEIKCPMKMYGPVKQYMNQVSNGWIPPKDYMNHIWETHYCQMILSMAVLGKKWCDYVVYSTTDNLVFTQRIPFNEKYWKERLYPGIEKNYNLYVKPYINGNYPLTPKN